MVKVISAGTNLATINEDIKVFISINGAPNWEDVFIGKWDASLQNRFTKSIAFIIPGKSSVNKEDYQDNSFYKRTNWESLAMEQSDYIIVNLTSAAITPSILFEIGLYAKTDKLLIWCEDSFCKKGYIDVMCEKYNIRQFNSRDEIISFLLNKVR